jgi:pSer/pThr/pTyr-binding forkhead associated (FHA) protein/tRNA A-37 threonylcarbamoyl transferase component Bud32
MAKLRITVGDQTVEQELEKDEYLAGRSPDLDLTLPIKEASRKHFRIWRHDDGVWRLKDLDSTNGTLVNGQSTKVSKLKHKDTIEVGHDCKIRFLDPKPMVLKSRADRIKEQKDEELRRKRELLKKKQQEALAAKQEAATATQELAGTIDIDSETMLDRLLKDRDALDAALAKGDKIFTFGQYHLLKRLSEGGMGVVFKAEHRKKAFRVALKVLRSEMVDENNIARFKQEAWAISAFDHPNIVTVRDLAKHGGMYYIAMDFIDGQDLLAVGFQRTLTFWQVMETIDKLADVLRLVHKRNIWHRDIKPQNVLMDRKGEIKLIDFGIATVEREKDDATETAEGLIMGTPAFLSPEQAARGKMGAIDGRADLYSLGAVMYYLLTGRRPFTGKSAIEILKKNMLEPPPPPRAVEEMVPPGLEQICLKLMEKQPDDRYRSASVLQEALAKWRKTKGGRDELERHKKIMALREKKKKRLLAQKKAQARKE